MLMVFLCNFNRLDLGAQEPQGPFVTELKLKKKQSCNFNSGGEGPRRPIFSTVAHFCSAEEPQNYVVNDQGLKKR